MRGPCLRPTSASAPFIESRYSEVTVGDETLALCRGQRFYASGSRRPAYQKTLFVPYPTLFIRAYEGTASVADRSIYLLAVFMLI